MRAFRKKHQRVSRVWDIIKIHSGIDRHYVVFRDQRRTLFLDVIVIVVRILKEE